MHIYYIYRDGIGRPGSDVDEGFLPHCKNIKMTDDYALQYKSIMVGIF